MSTTRTHFVATEVESAMPPLEQAQEVGHIRKDRIFSGKGRAITYTTTDNQRPDISGKGRAITYTTTDNMFMHVYA